MTSRWNQTLEAWTEMIRSANSRWEAALDVGRNPKEFTTDRWLGEMIGAWVASVDGFNNLANVWLGAPPSLRDLPTIGVVVDAASETASGEVSVYRSLPSRADIRNTALIGAQGALIPAEKVSIEIGQNRVHVTVTVTDRPANVPLAPEHYYPAGQYIGMIYQEAPTVPRPVIANIHLVRLGPAGASQGRPSPAASDELSDMRQQIEDIRRRMEELESQSQVKDSSETSVNQ